MIDVSRSSNYIGDCRDLLTQLPEASVQTCITSPPYWGLRDYGTARWDGGDPTCDHRESTPSRTSASIASSTLGGGKATVHASHVFRGNCDRCGALRIDRQIGLEPTPELYVAAIVEVLRLVRRSLCDDGTLWLNLGDSYANAGGAYDDTGSPGSSSTAVSRKTRSAVVAQRKRKHPSGIKPKDLVGIPWMVAFALRADGWYLRQDIIWSKANPMPESVTDRCTKSHEYLFLLSKNRRYYFDNSAIAEPAICGANGSRFDTGKTAEHQLTRASVVERDDRDIRNKRSVWTVASQPYSEAHFATFPPKLIEPCVLAGSRPGDLVLDPFFGSGTTGAVAEKHGRRWVGFDLSYDALAKSRTAQRTLPMGAV